MRGIMWESDRRVKVECIVKKYKSFVKSKRIFWEQGTDAKSLVSGITEIRMDEFIELLKEHNLETLGLFV